MDKKVKWGIIVLIGAGIIGGGIYSQLPKENEELTVADKVVTLSLIHISEPTRPY